MILPGAYDVDQLHIQEGGKGAGIWPSQHHLLVDIWHSGLWWEPRELCHLRRPHGGDTPVPKSQAASLGEAAQLPKL